MVSVQGDGWYFLFYVSTYPCPLAYCCCVLVDHFERDVPHILSRVFGWVKAHGHCSIEFEERSSKIWVLVRTWDRSTFRRVCVAVLSRFSANTTLEATILAEILDAAGPDTFVVSLQGSTCASRSFCKLSGKWIPCEARRVPYF